MPTYNGLHRQQLYHWIGRHIHPQSDGEKRTPLSDKQRKMYIDCLKGVLDNGLWVKTPEIPDQLADGKLIKVHRPIVCFTEWSLDQSLPHTTRYGRMGLGFPKRFVLNRGGQPVTYVRDSNKSDPYTKALKTIAEYLPMIGAGTGLTRPELRELKDYFDYLTHFNKRIRKPVSVTTTPAQKKRKSREAPNPYKRLFGRTLHFLEEREWRIVFHQSIASHFEKGGDAPGQPDHFLPFSPGKELYTLVLPDNETVNMAIHDTRIRKQLFPENAPHVTVISLQDIGTF